MCEHKTKGWNDLTHLASEPVTINNKKEYNIVLASLGNVLSYETKCDLALQSNIEL